jgi:transposase
MRRFVEGSDRSQSTLFPECLEDWIGEDNTVRAIDVFVDELDLGALGFGGVDPEATGRPSYHPSVLLKLYIYGYLNRVQSSRRLEHEAGRNVEVMWLMRNPRQCGHRFRRKAATQSDRKRPPIPNEGGHPVDGVKRGTLSAV